MPVILTQRRQDAKLFLGVLAPRFFAGASFDNVSRDDPVGHLYRRETAVEEGYLSELAMSSPRAGSFQPVSEYTMSFFCQNSTYCLVAGPRYCGLDSMSTP